jgi:WD40 repeat protein
MPLCEGVGRKSDSLLRFLILLQTTCYEGHTGNVTAVGFSCDGSWMYSGGEDETVKIWDVR